MEDLTLGPTNNVDWKVLLQKYLEVVGRCEGTDFLYEGEWEPEEWAAFQQLWNEEPQYNKLDKQLQEHRKAFK